MYLFVWFDILSDNTEGIVFAHATDREEAIQLIHDAYIVGETTRITSYPMNEQQKETHIAHIHKTAEWLTGELRRRDPFVVEGPWGHYLWGGG